MLPRGKEFKGITVLVNAEEIKHSLLGDGSSKEDVQDKRKKLKFELQMKERELERLESYGADSSDVQIDQLKSTIEKLSVKLQQLENSAGTQSFPQLDYLKKCYDFYVQHNLYHLSDIGFSDCFKNIPFYDFKHFFQDLIAGIYVKDGKITAIEFCTKQEKREAHQFR